MTNKSMVRKIPLMPLYAINYYILINFDNDRIEIK